MSKITVAQKLKNYSFHITGGIQYVAGTVIILLILIVILQKNHFFLKQSIASSNPIQTENQLPGTTAWQMTNPSKNGEIQAYAGKDSINTGGSVNLYVSTKASDTYQIDIYRLGYYGGKGGTLKQTITGNSSNPQGYYLNTNPPASYPTNCPTCIVSKKDVNGVEMNITDANWNVSTTITFPTSWISGVYEIVLTESNGYQWAVPLVVRDDQRTAGLVFQAPFNTDQAYNLWGGADLYNDCRDFPGSCTSSTSASWAYEISYNRPYLISSGTGWLFSWWYNMVRFLEQQGYDTTYTSNTAVAEGDTNLLNYKGFVSAGHDEYWSYQERQKLEQAITNSINVAFFGGNDIYWQIRNDADNNGNANRNIISYKQADVDPINNPPNNPNSYLTTVRWREAPVNNPEDKILKSMYIGSMDWGTSVDFVATNSASWVYTNSGLHDGDHITGIVGYEADAVFKDGSITSNDNVTVIGQSPFVSLGGKSLISNATLDELQSTNNIVFNGGTIYWPLGLTDFRVKSYIPESPALEQMTNNVLQHMVQGPTPTLTPTSTLTPVPTATPTPTPNSTPTPTPIPIKLDAVSPAQHNGSTSSLSWSHTAGTGSNRILLVGVSTFGLSVSAVTYAGSSLTKLSSLNCPNSNCHDELWYMKNPPSGTATVNVKFSVSTAVVAGSVTFYNVNQTNTFGTVATGNGTGASSSVSVSTTSTQMVVDSLTNTAKNSTWLPSQTKLWTDGTVNGGGASYKSGVSGTITMSWSHGASTDSWADIVVPLNQAQ